jgi:TonB family protein
MPRLKRTLLPLLQVVIVGLTLATSAPRLPAQNHEPLSPPAFGNGVQILSSTGGVDFRSYMQYMLASIKRKWFEKLPEEAMMGDKGRVEILVTIQKDGAVLGQGPVIDISSKNKALDKAALEAVRASAPFAHLPDAFSGPDLKLRLFFFYNIRPQK